jgi:hypothetical protein
MPPEAHDPTGPPGALERPGYEEADLLTAGGLRAEQVWRRQRLRRHNRHLHGWGVVCGLWVVPALDGARPWGVFVCPGYALGPYGDEVLVPCRILVDVRESLWSRPLAGAPTAYLAIRYREVGRAPAPGPASACGCDGAAPRARATRLADGVRIDLLWELPAEPAAAPFDLCRDLPRCPPCPEYPHLVLASIALPADEGSPIGIDAIDNGVRRSI